LVGSPDIVFPGPKVAVFVDGCFWHGCPEHYRTPAENTEFWVRKLQVNRERDERVDEELRTAGWAIERVWEHETRRASIPAARITGVIHTATARRRSARAS